jgi:hypothetical protein
MKGRWRRMKVYNVKLMSIVCSGKLSIEILFGTTPRYGAEFSTTHERSEEIFMEALHCRCDARGNGRHMSDLVCRDW